MRRVGSLFLALVAALAALGGSTSVADVDNVGPGLYRGPPPSALPDGMTLFADDVHHQCGKYALVFRNPDLREDASDFIHAQGQFFIQFQAVGSGSSEVTRLSFSFGATVDALHGDATLNCNDDIPPTQMGQGTAGAYLLYYRSDFNADDGFFVPILTRNVPDGEYAAAIHAYNEAGTEVARAWARAVVENCPSELSGPGQCPQSEADDYFIKSDHTQPWPMILPGDGQQTNDVDGLTIEFAEEIQDASVLVTVNGEAVPVAAWDNPMRDSDLMPLNDEEDCPNGQQVKGFCERIDYGSGYQADVQVNEGDVVRVTAMDKNQNLVEKTVHYGSATSSGTVDLDAPEVLLQVLNGEIAAIRPGDFHEYNIRLDNIGNGDAHVSLLTRVTLLNGDPVQAPDGFEAYWTTVEGEKTEHVVVPSGVQTNIKVRVVTEPTTPERDYRIEGVLEYDVGGQQQYKSTFLETHVSMSASADHQHSHGAGIATPTPTTSNASALNATGGDSPGAGPLLVAGGVVLAVVIAARVRRDD